MCQASPWQQYCEAGIGPFCKQAKWVTQSSIMNSVMQDCDLTQFFGAKAWGAFLHSASVLGTGWQWALGTQQEDISWPSLCLGRATCLVLGWNAARVNMDHLQICSQKNHMTYHAVLSLFVGWETNSRSWHHYLVGNHPQESPSKTFMSDIS